MNSTSIPIAGSPFLTISPAWRVVLLTFLIFYQVVFPAVAAIGNSDAQELLLPRMVAHSVLALLIMSPLIFYRREYGFLHPLLLPLLVGSVQDILKNPAGLVVPISLPMFDYGVSTYSIASTLAVNHTELASLRLWLDIVKIVGVFSYFAGYFLLKIFPIPRTVFHPPRNLPQISLAATAICLLVGLIFIQFAQGGLSNHLIAMRSGRSELFAGSGQILVIAEWSILAVLVWFVYERRPFTNPLWLSGFVLALFMTLVISGSRSSMIMAMVVFVLLWWRRERRVLVAPTAIAAVCAVLVIGVFGSIRQDYGSGTINTSVFSPTELASNFSRAKVEFQKRGDEEGDLAAFAGAKNGLLWGRSYVAGAAFWIPRAVWKDKPRGAGAYNMWVNFAGKPLETFGTGTYWGIPMSAITEAYWNLHVPGVILVMLLFGAFHRWLSDLVLTYYGTPIVLLFSVWMSTHFSGDPNSFISAARDAGLIVVLALALGIWRGPARFAARGPTGAQRPRPVQTAPMSP